MFYRENYRIMVLIKVKTDFIDKLIICVNELNYDEKGVFDCDKNVILNKEKIDQCFEKQKKLEYWLLEGLTIYNIEGK